jgi:hypothetical protein
VSSLEADLADGCWVDLVKLVELGECLAGGFLGEDGFAGF